MFKVLRLSGEAIAFNVTILLITFALLLSSVTAHEQAFRNAYPTSRTPSDTGENFEHADEEITSMVHMELLQQPHSLSFSTRPDKEEKHNFTSFVTGSPSSKSVGVLMGYSDAAMVSPGSPAATSIHLARRWARRHGYSFFLEPNLGRISRRTRNKGFSPYWDKLHAVENLLPKVDILLWLDLDVFIIDLDRSIADLLSSNPAQCKSTGQRKNDLELAEADVVFWAATARFEHAKGQTLLHEEPVFPITLCTGMFAIQNTALSFKLIDLAIRDSQVVLEDNWPYEQGSIWRVLLKDKELLRSTCVLPETSFLFESLDPEDVGISTSFAIHATGRIQINSPESKTQLNSKVAVAACSRAMGSVDECDAI